MALFGQVESVAHRGASLSAPENTLASTVKAIELGVDRIEMDVRQSKDGVLVLMHDVTLNARQMARAICVTLPMTTSDP